MKARLAQAGPPPRHAEHFRGREKTGDDGIDPDTGAGPPGRQRPAETQDAGLGGGIAGLPGQAALGRDRGNSTIDGQRPWHKAGNAASPTPAAPITASRPPNRSTVSTTAWRALSSSAVRSAVTAASVPGNSMPTTSAPIAVSATDSARPSPQLEPQFPPANASSAVPAGAAPPSSTARAEHRRSGVGWKVSWRSLQGREIHYVLQTIAYLSAHFFLAGIQPSYRLAGIPHTAGRWPHTAAGAAPPSAF